MATKLPIAGLIRTPGLPVRVSRFKAVVAVEMVVLLLFSVALTIAPQVTLSAMAGAFTWARDFSMIYRPAVALVGLLLVAAFSVGLWVLLRASEQTARERPSTDTAAPSEESKSAGKAA